MALGVAIGSVLRAGDVLLVDGDLGAGKTRLVRGIAESLGVDPAQVSSPTYVLIHEYDAPGTSIGTLFHLDAYRLSGPAELDSLGFERVMEAFGVVVIEWADRIREAFEDHPSLASLRIRAGGPGPMDRSLRLEAPRAWTLRPQWSGLRLLAQASTNAPDRCPVTGKPVTPDLPTYPFVDERARMADLERWMSGHYVVSRELTPDDDLSGDSFSGDSFNPRPDGRFGSPPGGGLS